MTNFGQILETGVSIVIIIAIAILIRLHMKRELYGSRVPFWRTVWNAIFHPYKAKEARRSLKLLILFHLLFFGGIALIAFLTAAANER